MSSTFSTYRIASTGMYTNQAALTTVSHNLSNVNTDGYSRQRIISSEQTVASTGTSCSSRGVKVGDISRERDCFLDQTYRQAKSQTEYYDAKNTTIQNAQKLLNEYDSSSGTSTTSDNGVQKTINNLFDSWDQLTKDPDSPSTRKAMIENADALVDTVNEINKQLIQMQQDAATRVTDSVKSLNDKAQQVVKLNEQITRAECGGEQANDLRDQRDEIIDEMSELANVNVVEQNGVLNVSIGGIALVDGGRTHTLTVDNSDGLVKVKWAEMDTDANIGSGSIKAWQEEANQTDVTEITNPDTYNYTNSSTSVINNIRQGLNDLITTIADKINDLVTSGKDLDGNAGTAIFVKTDTNKPFMIGNIQVNDAVRANTNKIATGTSGQAGDYTIASKVVALKTDSNFTYDGLAQNLTDYYQSFTSWISNTGNTFDSNYSTQNAMLQQAQNQRQSISSVSEDEEMSKMIVYQNAYNASARVLSTVDKLIGDLISALGK